MILLYYVQYLNQLLYSARGEVKGITIKPLRSGVTPSGR